MDEQLNQNRPSNPRRRKRTTAQIIKEDYLPVVIIGINAIMILTFIIGSIVRGVQEKQYKNQQLQEASIAAQEEYERLSAEADALLSEAHDLAKHFDYAGAISVLDRFQGDLTKFHTLTERREEYVKASENLTAWSDPSQVIHLSFQPLIADPTRAFNDATYGNSYKNNYVTVDEFSKILLQLYENGFVLVRLSDLTAKDGGMELMLPNGKKPLIITETHVNYNTYMVDGDGDKLPDKAGDGFASRLLVDENGNLTCELVNADGTITTGAYDIVPILNSFIETHPDFSYKGAKAVLALTGYDGLFGYRTTPSAAEYFGKSFYDEQVNNAKAVISAVRENGYELACYSYENESYGNFTPEQIKSDMDKWNNEVVPLLGSLDTFVFCRNSDIGEANTSYTGAKFEMLQSYGFKNYVGFSSGGKCWYVNCGDYNRMGRILVTGNNMKTHADWFDGIFDSSSLLDTARN